VLSAPQTLQGSPTFSSAVLRGVHGLSSMDICKVSPDGTSQVSRRPFSNSRILRRDWEDVMSSPGGSARPFFGARCYVQIAASHKDPATEAHCGLGRFLDDVWEL